MKKFKFSLEPLRVLMERQEQTALVQYAESVMALESAKKRQLAVEGELDALSVLVESRMKAQCCSASDLSHIQEYCQVVSREKRLRERETAAAAQQSQLAFTKLVAARKASAVVNRYYEIQKRRYTQECTAEEQKFLDELSQRQVETPLQAVFTPENVWN
jgi:flagellar export protein FliJ